MKTTQDQGRAMAAETFRRRYAGGYHKPRARSAVREGADPAVRFILERLPDSVATMRAEVAAGLGENTIRDWRYRGDPKVWTLRRALRALGFDLAVVDLQTREVV